MVNIILNQMGFPEKPVAITPFANPEDGSLYQVWRIDYPTGSCVLKQAKERESLIYRTYFSEPKPYAPLLLASVCVDGNEFLLMEYIPGRDLTYCTRNDLTVSVESLAAMQSEYWGAVMASDALDTRKARLAYLDNPLLMQAYNTYLERCKHMPATLCHDDLLPFNVIVSGNRGVFIDWEAAGILPYPTSLARLIAHAEDREDSLFRMRDDDKAYAVDLYYSRLVQDKGVHYDVYREDLDFCLLYEYCEWVYVCNKYHNTGDERFQKYLDLAVSQAKKLRF